MEISTKNVTIIKSIKFNKDEKTFMETLAKYIHDTCNANAHCEFCPFITVRDTARANCGRIADGLASLAKYKERRH